MPTSKTILPKLVNNPLGDPGLHVEFTLINRGLLFDLGDISRLSAAKLLKLTDVFISHTHIDHFIGFDRLLRVVFGHPKTLRLYGPEGFAANVQGKLKGFTWNLVDRYEENLILEVTEVHKNKLIHSRFSAIDRFEQSDIKETPNTNQLLLDEATFSVKTAILEHRIPCLGFAVEEKEHLNIDKEKLDSLSLLPGPWLNTLKESLKNGIDLSQKIDVPALGQKDKTLLTLKELKDNLIVKTDGQKIAYITDTVYTEANKKNIVDLVKNADILFCESPFTADEKDRALERRHLTSEQAGLIAREARVKELQVFHFSPRHSNETQRLYDEANAAFLGS